MSAAVCHFSPDFKLLELCLWLMYMQKGKIFQMETLTFSELHIALIQQQKKKKVKIPPLEGFSQTAILIFSMEHLKHDPSTEVTSCFYKKKKKKTFSMQSRLECLLSLQISSLQGVWFSQAMSLELTGQREGFGSVYNLTFLQPQHLNQYMLLLPTYSTI